jgi:hypothetical protein
MLIATTVRVTAVAIFLEWIAFRGHGIAMVKSRLRRHSVIARGTHDPPRAKRNLSG